ncbi:hypothetical protein FACS189472_07330 [Alphaproteobacteria bacterium]|nr:hypothetical protein FACS189472_07330 [Alphaproteobacteria bacterium]
MIGLCIDFEILILETYGNRIGGSGGGAGNGRRGRTRLELELDGPNGPEALPKLELMLDAI